MSSPGPGRLPDFIIAGAMRCGTTALNSYLRDHPDVAMASSKEVHYFDAHFDRGIDWYRSQFPESEEAVAVGEATPNYLFRPVALQRIKDTLPEVKLIFVLRNPIDRAYSHYWHDRARGKLTVEFSEIIDRELDGEDIGPAAYVARGRYADQMAEVLQRFERNQIMVEAFENLTARPTEVYAATCRFIGVDDGFRPDRLGEPVNAFLQFRSLRLREFARRLPKRAQSAVGRLNRRDSAAYPEMAPDVRARLRDVFDVANAGLSELLNWQPPAWR